LSQTTEEAPLAIHFPPANPHKRPALRAGGYGRGHAKQDLLDAIEAEIAPMRERCLSLMQTTEVLDAILDEGAARARKIAQATMERVREATGISKGAPSDMRATIKVKL